MKLKKNEIVLGFLFSGLAFGFLFPFKTPLDESNEDRLTSLMLTMNEPQDNLGIGKVQVLDFIELSNGLPRLWSSSACSSWLGLPSIELINEVIKCVR